MDAQVELIQLRELAPAAELWAVGGKPIAFLPDVEFAAGSSRVVRDLLLWPRERDGYKSRLFLSEPVTSGQAANWNVFNIQGRPWHGCSWQGVQNTLPWIEIVAAHLRAFR